MAVPESPITYYSWFNHNRRIDARRPIGFGFRSVKVMLESLDSVLRYFRHYFSHIYSDCTHAHVFPRFHEY